MISEQALERAVERGILTADQAAQLRALEHAEAADDEQLHLVSGFADIFVTLGILLFVGALAFIMDGGAGSTPALAGIAGSSWLLAEFFTGQRRMALPSIVLLLLFVGGVLLVSLQVFSALLPASHGLPARLWFLPTPNAAALAVAALVTAALASLHYLRFRVPITVAAGVAALCLLAIGLVASLDPDMGETLANAVLLLCGLAAFALAMGFDGSDPERRTRRSDVAFWLHLLAAPLIVHPLMRAVLHAFGGALTPAAAVAVLWIFVGLGLVAVAVDRRAILVAGLVYAGVAGGTLVRSVGVAHDAYLVAGVLLALGAFILLLSAGWHPLRRAILRRLPRPLARRLPHPLPASQT